MLSPCTYTAAAARLGCARTVELNGSRGQTTLELNATMTALDHTVQIYGLGVRGPLSAEDGVNASAIEVRRVGTFKLMQSTITAPAGHGVVTAGTGSGDGVVISGVTLNEVRNSGIGASDALGSWTISGNVSKGPIGRHGIFFNAGDATVSIDNNQFESINGDAMRATGALGSWTISGNVSKGPISGDGISIAGGHADASVTIDNNEFEQIDGNGISAQDALGSWTISGNVSRGPIGGHAMHFHNQGGTITLNNNTITGGDGVNAGTAGILASEGFAAWTVTANSINGNELGPQVGLGLETLKLKELDSTTTPSTAWAAWVSVSRATSRGALNGNMISDTWSNTGGGPLARVGLGLALVDTTKVTMTGNTISNNAFAGVLIDLKDWDDANGVATLTLTDNVTSGNNQQSNRDVVKQNITQTAVITITNSGDDDTLEADDRVSVTRAETPAPRCGDGEVDQSLGEECEPPGQGDCDAFCQLIAQQNYIALAGGPRHFCALHVNGQTHCMGYNDMGQIGESQGQSRDNRRLERRFGLLKRPIPKSRQVTTYLRFNRPRKVECWGDNALRQLGLFNPIKFDACPH